MWRVVNSVKRFVLVTLSIILLVALGNVPTVAAQFSGHPGPKPNKKVLHVKFKEDADVALQDGQFVSQTGVDTSAVNAVLSQGKKVRKQELFAAGRNQLKKQHQDLKNVRSDVPDLSSYYRLEVTEGTDSETLSRELKKMDVVAEAYPEMPPTPSPSPSYVSSQAFLHTNPDGMNEDGARKYPGNFGDKIKVGNVAYSWNTNHEDLSVARKAGTLVNNGTPQDPFETSESPKGDTPHGTAVAGMLAADRANGGVDGFVPRTSLRLVNVQNYERGFDVSNAIQIATQQLSAGDVLLVEISVWSNNAGPYDTLLPAEWSPELYDLIKTATAKGITVVETAGNSGKNLDDPAYGTTSFPQNKPDSGAIIVGAGNVCNSQPDRSRWLVANPYDPINGKGSNYGKRVNVQGYGECSTVSGWYGNLTPSASYNSWYANDFGGTSAAGAMVAGAAASISSAYRFAKGTPITPQLLRSTLQSTGTPQDTSINPGRVGPLPNIPAAMNAFGLTRDVTTPSIPVNLKATQINKTSMKLTWNASTDASGIWAYQVYRNDAYYKTVKNATQLTETGLVANTTYTYKVRAFDAVDNISPFSSTLSFKPDTTAPTVPANLKATPTTDHKVQLTWSPSTDASGIKSYQIFRNGSLYKTVTTASYLDTSVTIGTTYSYKVQAVDNANNSGSFSSTVSALVK